MHFYPNTQGYSRPKEIEANPYKVFVAKSIRFVEVDKTPTEYDPEPRDYWLYDLYEYEASEYVKETVKTEAKNRADIEYIAMMTDVDLEEGDDENVEEI